MIHTLFIFIIYTVFIKTASIILAIALVNSCYDYCNSLFYGLSKYSIYSQNTVATLIPHFSVSFTLAVFFKSLKWLTVMYCII